MNLINVKVTHATFGEGVVAAQNGDYITVKFPSKECRFVSPDAFSKYIKCEDEKLQHELEFAFSVKQEALDKKAQEEREAKRKAEEEARRRAEEEKRRKRVVYDRHADENNLAFKCNFCNGGCDSSCLGFKSVCSDELIRYNIEKKGRAWCSDENDSSCYKYYKGLIDREELEKTHKTRAVCYESRMLVDWKAEAGEDRNGIDGPRARRITNASKDSLAVLTTELPDMEGGKERVIFGVFITGIVDEGDDIQAGYVKAAGDYYVELTPSEAKTMKFWHYHKNHNNPDVVQWGTGLYRYMKDTTCARILLDIISIKKNPAEKKQVQKMLEYYCKVKKLDINNIPAADGAI